MQKDVQVTFFVYFILMNDKKMLININIIGRVPMAMMDRYQPDQQANSQVNFFFIV